MTPSTVTNPRYLDASRTRIVCDVVWAGLEQDGAGVFIADPADCTDHGRELHAALEAGEYGPIGDPDA